MKDWIELDDYDVDCVIGVLADEQRRTQPVSVSLKVALDLDAVAGGDLTAGFDYAAIAAQVAFLLEYGQWRLLESVATAIARLLLAPAAPGESRGDATDVFVRLRKPTILAAGTPGIAITRDAMWCDLETRMVPPKTWVDVLAETPKVGAYRMHLEPGTSWEVPPGAALYPLTDGLSADETALSAGVVVAREAVTSVDNGSSETASMLVVMPPMAD